MSQTTTTDAAPQPLTEAAAAARDAVSASLQQATEHVPEDRRPEIEKLAAQLTITDPGSILRFGQDAQSRATAAADAMLEGARNREAGEAGQTLSNLLGTLRGFDMSGLEPKTGFFARLFGRARAETARVVQRYETIKGQVEEVGDRLDTHRTRLLEDVEKLERLYGATLDWFHALGDHIAAGDVVLARLDREAIPTVEREVASGDAVAAQRLRDLRAARDELERRVHDLKLTRQVAMQALPSIRLIQENDKALAAKIQSVIANTVPLWRQQLAQALAIQNMREAGRTLKEATDLTNGDRPHQRVAHRQCRAAAPGQYRGADAARARGLRHRGGEEGQCLAGRHHRGLAAHRAGRAGEPCRREQGAGEGGAGHPPRPALRPRGRAVQPAAAAALIPAAAPRSRTEPRPPGPPYGPMLSAKAATSRTVSG